MTTLEAAANALAHDAHLWDQVSGVLTHQASNAQSMNLEYDAFPHDTPEIGVVYTQVQAKIHELLRDGGTEAAAISATLRLVQSDLVSTDESVRDSLRGLWNPRELP